MGECRIERTDNKRHSSVSLLSIAAVFLRLGSSAFGGPAAHIALMETELVVRRQWITAEEFLDPPGAANLIPGPSSTELALHIGYKKAGWAGFMMPECALYHRPRDRVGNDSCPLYALRQTPENDSSALRRQGSHDRYSVSGVGVPGSKHP